MRSSQNKCCTSLDNPPKQKKVAPSPRSAERSEVFCKVLLAKYVTPNAKKENCFSTVLFFCVGIDLFSRLVAKQVSSALVSLTSVFGMGTGGPSPLKTPTPSEKTSFRFLRLSPSSTLFRFLFLFRSMSAFA